MDVAPLSLEFKNWPLGSLVRIAKPYGPPNYDSQAEYTYFPTGGDPNSIGVTYFNPVCRGIAYATVPEPASILLAFLGFAGSVAFARHHRRKAKARTKG